MKSLMRLYAFVRPYRMQAVAALALLLGMVVADLIIPHLTRKIIDEGIVPGNFSVILSTSLIMVGASLLSAAFAIANNFLSVSVSMHFGADIRSALIRKVQTFSFGNLDHLQTGNLIVRSTSDVNQVQMIVMLSLRILTRAPLWATGAIILLVMTAPRLALLMVVFVPVIIIPVLYFGRVARPMFLRVQKRLDRLNVILQENLAGVRVVKAFVRSSHEIARFDGANELLMHGTIRVAGLLAIFSPVMLLVLNLAIIGAVWLGGQAAVEGSMSVGQVVAAINYLSFALFPILMLAGMLGPVSSADASASRILEILDTESETAQSKSPLILANPRGRIVFEDVSFHYSGNGGESVLSEISFTAEPGETVAVVGATGSGKSTLIHLIPRFYDVTSGRITFDGTDLRDFDLSSLRSAVGVALQESVLFSGTIRENICYGMRDAREQDIVAAARAAQADEFITALSDGYDTPVGQRGVTLSGGQRQRIAIARALLVKPRVLILDDSTSALDIETEVKLQDALDQLLTNSNHSTTRFIVAQRISTVLLADKIVVLDQGQISGMGTHRTLLEENAVYRDIYRSQLGEPSMERSGSHD